MAVYLLVKPAYLWVLILSDLLLAGAILVYLPTEADSVLLLMPFVAWFATSFARKRWQHLTLYWQKLLLIVALVIVHSAATGLTFVLLGKPLRINADTITAVTVASLTGGIVLTPFLYLVADYLRHQTWSPLTPQLIHQDVKLKPKMLVWSLFSSP